MKGANRVALITPSHGEDFERCRLLCDSVDAFVEAEPDHFILVDDRDFAKFTELGGPRRHVINELDILPSWLHSFKTGLAKNSRKLWWSNRTWPMRGWHVQQLRRIAIAGHISHQGLLFCDSDMLFVKPFSLSQLWRGDDFRLYCKKGGISSDLPGGGRLHMDWTRGAARLNGLPQAEFPADDYINNLVSWKRKHVLKMCAHIEATTGKNWVAAFGSSRSFSECQIYGAYVDGVLSGSGHWRAGSALCKTYWSGDAMNGAELFEFVDSMKAGQVAVGIQSFTGTDLKTLRALISR